MKKTLILLCSLFTLAVAGRAQADTITVDTLTDPPIPDATVCSLRQAIQAANTDTAVGGCPTGNGDDIIELPDLGGPYVLTENPAGFQNDNFTGDLDICSNITINGQGLDTTVIRTQFNNGMDRVLQIFNEVDTGNGVFGCTFTPAPGGAGVGGAGNGCIVPIVEINGVTLENGHAIDTFNGVLGGGGILNAGVLTLNDSSVSGNTADNSQIPDLNVYGGGLLNLGQAVLARSLVQNNSVVSQTFNNGFSSFGGGIACNGDGDVCQQPLMFINNSQVNGNMADSGSGGGIGVFAGFQNCNTEVLRSAVYDNQVVGFTANTSNFGTGGGISHVAGDASTQEFFLVDSTVSGNMTPQEGGGFFESSGQATVVELLSSTIAFNDAGTAGGGVFRSRDALDGTISLLNTILSNNAAVQGPDCFNQDNPGMITSVGYNLIQDPTDCVVDGPQTGDITGQDPLLGALMNNGGLTPTHALTTGSPALDMARPVADGGCVDAINGGAELLFDQRDDPFDRTVAAVIGGQPRCDIGAYEFSPTAIDSSKTVNTPTAEVGDIVTYTITVTNLGPGQATGVTITDPLPAEVNFSSFGTISQGTCVNNADVITCDIGTLMDGEVATVEVNVLVVAEGEVVNQATITTNETEPQNRTATFVTGAIFVEGSGILPCSLQRGPVAAHVPFVLMGLMGFGLGILVVKRVGRR